MLSTYTIHNNNAIDNPPITQPAAPAYFTDHYLSPAGIPSEPLPLFLVPDLLQVFKKEGFNEKDYDYNDYQGKPYQTSAFYVLRNLSAVNRATFAKRFEAKKVISLSFQNNEQVAQFLAACQYSRDPNRTDNPIRCKEDFQHVEKLSLCFQKYEDEALTIEQCTALLTHLPNLTYLGIHLDGLPLASLTPLLEVAQRLRLMDLQLNGGSINETEIERLPEALWQLTHLAFLELNSLPIQEITGIQNLINLERLEIRFANQLTALSTEIGALKKLNYLGLCFLNQFQTLPEEIGALSQLKVLHLTSLDRLVALPTSLGQLKNLKTVHCHDVGITALPLEIGNAIALNSLLLSGNKLQSLPDTIGNLSNLKELRLSAQRITHLPATLGQLKNLQSLRLSQLNIRRLPHALWQLTQLKEFSLWNLSALSHPEDLKDLANLTQLHTLTLHNVPLSIIPFSFHQFSHLETLELGSLKELTDLPDDIGQLPVLKSLKLDDLGRSISTFNPNANCITHLPNSLWNLTTLHFLEISSLPIESLSEKISQLSHLQSLRLINLSHLTDLPDGLWQLAQLKHLDLSTSGIHSFMAQAKVDKILTNITRLPLQSLNLFNFASREMISNFEQQHAAWLGQLKYR